SICRFPYRYLVHVLPMSPWGVDCIIIRRTCVGARRAVSEGSDLLIGLPCGLSAPRDCYRIGGTRGYSEFPAYSQVCSGSSRIRSRNTCLRLSPPCSDLAPAVPLVCARPGGRTRN